MNERVLNMASGYDLAVMYDLMSIVANHSSVKFSRLEYGDDIDTKNWKEMDFCCFEERVQHMSDSEAELLRQLKATLAAVSNSKQCKQMFQVCFIRNAAHTDTCFYRVVTQMALAN